MNYLGIYQTKSLGSAYSLLQEAFLTGQLELVEFVPGAGGATLLVKGPSESLKELAVKAGTDSRYAFHLMNGYAETILKALYSLENPPLKAHFGILETEDSAELFRVADEAVRSGAQVVDLKLPRGTGQGKGSLILTADDDSVLSPARDKLKSDARWTLIRNRSEQFSQLF